MMCSLTMSAYTRGIWWERRNRGFYQVLHQLDYERSGMERLMGNYPLFEAIIQFARENELSRDAMIRNKLAQLQIEFEVGRLLIYRVAIGHGRRTGS